MAAATFQSEDEEAQYCLGLLRHGAPSEKVAARERLALIFTRRGMFEEATEAYEANVRAGVRTPELFEQLSDAYRRIGESGAAEAALAEARRLRAAASPAPPAASPALPAQPAPATGKAPRREPAPGDNGKLLQFPGPTHRLPASSGDALAATARLPASQAAPEDETSDGTAGAAAPNRGRQRRLALPGIVVIPGMILALVVAPVLALALLVINPLALALEGRAAGPTVNASAPTPQPLKVAPGSTVSWYVQAGRSVSGLWATQGLEMTLDQELGERGASFAVTGARLQSWGETITIVERRGQGRANQETILPATLALPATLPAGGAGISGRITGQVTAPRLSDTGQFNTTTEAIDAPVQLVVVSAPELWLDRFWNSLRMFFQEDRWLLVTIGSLLTWCVVAGGAAILFRVRRA